MVGAFGPGGGAPQQPLMVDHPRAHGNRDGSGASGASERFDHAFNEDVSALTSDLIDANAVRRSLDATPTFSPTLTPQLMMSGAYYKKILRLKESDQPSEYWMYTRM